MDFKKLKNVKSFPYYNLYPIVLAVSPSLLTYWFGDAGFSGEVLLVVFVLIYLYIILKVPGDLLTLARLNTKTVESLDQTKRTMSHFYMLESLALVLYLAAPMLGGLGLYHSQCLFNSITISKLHVSIFVLAAYIQPLRDLASMLKIGIGFPLSSGFSDQDVTNYQAEMLDLKSRIHQLEIAKKASIVELDTITLKLKKNQEFFYDRFNTLESRLDQLELRSDHSSLLKTHLHLEEVNSKPKDDLITKAGQAVVKKISNVRDEPIDISMIGFKEFSAKGYSIATHLPYFGKRKESMSKEGPILGDIQHLNGKKEHSKNISNMNHLITNDFISKNDSTILNNCGTEKLVVSTEYERESTSESIHVRSLISDYLIPMFIFIFHTVVFLITKCCWFPIQVIKSLQLVSSFAMEVQSMYHLNHFNDPIMNLKKKSKAHFNNTIGHRGRKAGEPGY
ncbi:hypothetical protein BC833DRAFT_599760 [Globomyces pollinis-pini]|nr:hypothetical protein BC833DRAFT_599760 [Globomyces pollinis-pini]KAJ2999355.1 hypothetical protein HDV02_003136 [Globomyces sp. JEL0801]